MFLGVPTWSTKAELVARIGELRRQSKKHSAYSMEEVEKAFDTLCDVEAQTKYDESLGLSAKRRSRIDLRPLGFYSKSLSKAQQSWSVWERELLAVLETITHFSSMLTGQAVIIHTDHLNNTVLGNNLLRILIRFSECCLRLKV